MANSEKATLTIIQSARSMLNPQVFSGDAVKRVPISCQSDLLNLDECIIEGGGGTQISQRLGGDIVGI